MNKRDNINKLIEEALNSVDDAQRAEPRPFLLTRIHARMNKGTESVWEKAGWFISRPAVAFTGLCMIVLLNVMVVMVNKTSDSATVAEQTIQAQADEFSYTAATIYDNDNTP
jgi:NADH:ubiquinone oxidoreductase subunit 6 (subunit J)